MKNSNFTLLSIFMLTLPCINSWAEPPVAPSPTPLPFCINCHVDERYAQEKWVRDGGICEDTVNLYRVYVRQCVKTVCESGYYYDATPWMAVPYNPPEPITTEQCQNEERLPRDCPPPTCAYIPWVSDG